MSARAALLLIDMQVDFGAPDGAMARQGRDVTMAQAAMAKAVSLAEAARAGGIPVVFVRLLARPGEDLCVEGTAGADFIGPLPQPGETIVSKSRFSAFTGTGLAEQLRARGIDTVILAGLTTECCIQASAWAAFEQDFRVILAADACAAYEKDLHHHALRTLELSGATLASSAELSAQWIK
ncbi:MAG TPA: isochorismatase family cysteine hydrolase [Rhizomicrobium sp.]|jgi:ureidoacrylate peracid hydrolase